MPAFETAGSRFLKRHIIWILFFCFFAVPFYGSAAAADSSRNAFSLVTRALLAREHQIFSGRQEIVFSTSKESGWTRVVAEIARSGRRCRMEYRFPASVADMVVTNDGTFLREYHPNSHLYLIRRIPQREEAADAGTISLLRRNYRFARRPAQNVNGRRCDVVALTPRYGSGSSRLCWIDQTTKTILRTEKYDSLGRRLYVSSFTDVQFASHLPDRLFSLAPPLGATVQKAATPPGNLTFSEAWTQSGGHGRAPCWTPHGYHLLRCASLLRPNGAHALFLRYGDGLETLSVYEEAVSPELPPVMLQQKMLDDQLCRYGQQAWVREMEGLRVTVVGDGTLPPALGAEMMRALDAVTAQRLSRSLAKTFGPAGEAEESLLRRQGWGYDQIADRLLKRRSSDHPSQAARDWVGDALR